MTEKNVNTSELQFFIHKIGIMMINANRGNSSMLKETMGKVK